MINKLHCCEGDRDKIQCSCILNVFAVWLKGECVYKINTHTKRSQILWFKNKYQGRKKKDCRLFRKEEKKPKKAS